MKYTLLTPATKIAGELSIKLYNRLACLTCRYGISAKMAGKNWELKHFVPYKNRHNAFALCFLFLRYTLIMRGGEAVSHKAHNLGTRVQIPPPQQIGFHKNMASNNGLLK